MRVFEPLADGDPVDIVEGVQGGFHIWGALRLRDIDPLRVSIEYAVDDVDAGKNISINSYIITFQDSEPVFSQAGLIGMVTDDPSEAVKFRGRRIRLTMNVEDQGGKKATDSRVVISR